MNNVEKSNNKAEKFVDTPKPTEKIKPRTKLIEIGGPKGLEPTRYGDWEKKGRCIDF
ncbi:MAG: DUF1674 domain-containing protein [Legionellales bacterium]|nr:DUF1674 domain-containing protein [Legionellales bacterium]|tara:strand:+ start:65 stop:235 length:171 start_codon:yes stop_codon:yes gene_type:complete